MGTEGHVVGGGYQKRGVLTLECTLKQHVSYKREGDPAWATRRSQEAGAVLTAVCSLSRLHRVLTVRFKVQNVQVRTEVQNRTVATLLSATS